MPPPGLGGVTGPFYVGRKEVLYQSGGVGKLAGCPRPDPVGKARMAVRSRTPQRVCAVAKSGNLSMLSSQIKFEPILPPP